jgi:ABC-type sugar transport system ATPase subunit
MMESDSILELRDIHKTYDSVTALNSVSFHLKKGDIMGLVGDNGAGKSTLLKILNGYISPDSGKIGLDGVILQMRSPSEARDAGISMTYQHPAIVPNGYVWENFFLGREQAQALGPIRKLDKASMIAETKKKLHRYDVTSIDPNAHVHDLDGGEKQILAITRSIESNPKLLLLDEPMTEIAVTAKDNVTRFVRKLNEETGTSIIIVSHDLEILKNLVDKLLILANGAVVYDGNPDDLEVTDIVEYML